MRPFDHIIFDWNGTIVDDVALAVASLNSVREDCKLPALTLSQYRELFDFPIEQFYRRIGFDLDDRSFSALSSGYLGLFNAGVLACNTHAGADRTLAVARQMHSQTWVLSASHEDILIEDVTNRGLHDWFDDIVGLPDHFAAGKLELARRLDGRMGSPGPRALLIGDTLHDVEIARALGWTSVAVPNGHQSSRRLVAAHARICSDLYQVADLIKMHA